MTEPRPMSRKKKASVQIRWEGGANDNPKPTLFGRIIRLYA